MAKRTRRVSEGSVPSGTMDFFSLLDRTEHEQTGRAAYKERKGPDGLHSEALEAYDQAGAIDRYRERNGI